MDHAFNITPGSLIARRYEVQALLGRGGMGAVYRAIDGLLAETVALKVLDAGIASDETALRFRDEIRLARRVSHRNVCRIHEYGEDEGLRYISMAFVDGADLKCILRDQGPLPQLEAYAVALSVAAGLQAIHDEGIIHRDLKASNIMRSRAGVVQLMDFGIAKDALAPAAARLTCTGSIMGTPEYMSPEQAMGRGVDVRSDLYAFGIVAYELFTGCVPFHAETPMAVLLQQIREPVRLDVAEAAGVPAALKPVLARALAKEPADRFATAYEMGEAIVRASQARGTTDRTDVIVVPAGWPPPDAAPASARGRRAGPRATTGPRGYRRLARAALGSAAVAVMLLGGRWAREYVFGSDVPAPSPVVVSMAGAPADGGSSPGPTPEAPSPVPPVESMTEHGAPPDVPTDAPPPIEEPPAGTLRVIAVPWADVSIDGRTVRSQVIKGVRLSPGTHAVTLSHPDYAVTTRTVTVTTGRTTDLVVDLAEEGSRR